MNSKSRKNLWL